MTALPKPAYVMSEPHLSGWRVVLGYETLADAQSAQLAVSAPEAREGEAVAVTIFCPQCALPHVDEGEWATTRRHKTHQCQGCGHEWRPFPFATVGVTHPATPSADKLRIAVEAFGAITDLSVALRNGGPDSSDLNDLSDNLDSAVNIAAEALASMKADGA